MKVTVTVTQVIYCSISDNELHVESECDFNETTLTAFDDCDQEGISQIHVSEDPESKEEGNIDTSKKEDIPIVVGDSFALDVGATAVTTCKSASEGPGNKIETDSLAAKLREALILMG